MNLRTSIYNHDASFTTDVRRHKDYSRSGNVTIMVQLEDIQINIERLRYQDSGERFFNNKFDAPTPDGAVSRRLSKLIDDDDFFTRLIEPLESASIIVAPRYSWEGKDQVYPYVTVGINWVVTADKPSMICTEMEVLSMVNPLTVMKEVKRLAVQAIEWVNDRNSKLEFLTGVESLSESIVAEAIDKAVDKIKYDKKLKDLKAEFNARLEALKSETVAYTVSEGVMIWNELNSDGSEELPEWCTKEICEASERYWTRFIKPPRGGEFGRGYLSSSERQGTPLKLSELSIEQSEV